MHACVHALERKNACVCIWTYCSVVCLKEEGVPAIQKSFLLTGGGYTTCCCGDSLGCFVSHGVSNFLFRIWMLLQFFSWLKSIVLVGMHAFFLLGVSSEVFNMFEGKLFWCCVESLYFLYFKAAVIALLNEWI